MKALNVVQINLLGADMTKRAVEKAIEGSVAKVRWTRPHAMGLGRHLVARRLCAELG
jgi:hypothetical protein